MVTSITSLRLDKGIKNRLRAQAEEKGITLSKVIGDKLAKSEYLSDTASDIIGRLAEGLGISPSKILDAIVIDYAVRSENEQKWFGKKGLYGGGTPFVWRKGKEKDDPVIGQELYKFLKDQYDYAILCGDPVLKQKHKEYVEEQRQELQKRKEEHERKYGKVKDQDQKTVGDA